MSYDTQQTTVSGREGNHQVKKSHQHLQNDTVSGHRNILVQFIQRFDHFPKVREDYTQQEFAKGSGSNHNSNELRGRFNEALLTLVILSFILFLILIELFCALFPSSNMNSTDSRVQNVLSIDTAMHSLIPLYLNITFPHISCDNLELDVVDILGKQQNHIRTDLYKSPVDARGNLVYTGYYQYVQHANEAYDPKKDPTSTQFCGKCYIEPRSHHHGFDRKGGIVERHLNQFHSTECCNTCISVLEMYDKHNLPRPHVQEIEQCLTELVGVNPGCNLSGTVWIHRVRGNFHFLPGKSHEEGMSHIHAIDLADFFSFNVTHTIHHLWFGTHPLQSAQNYPMPLKNVGHLTRSRFEFVHYFIHIVPVNINEDFSMSSSKDPYDTSRWFTYSATKYEKIDLDKKKGQAVHESFGLPGVLFEYDFTPIVLNPKQSKLDWLHLATQLCSLIGALYIAHICSHFFIRLT